MKTQSRNNKDEGKSKQPSPFDYSKSILNSNTPIKMSQAYNPYIVNRAVAHHRDCIYTCQLLNEFNIEPDQHYTFLFNQISKYNRPFERWVSNKNVEENVFDLDLISKYYQCSIEIAREYLSLYTPEALETLRSAYGGKEGRKAEPVGES